MGFGMTMAENAGTGIIGQGMSLLFGGAQDRRQIKQQQKLTDMQSKAQKDMIDYSNKAQEAMQMSMWDKTNYKAQIDQMKKAGLSVSEMYGGSGAGGATVGGGGASGSVGGGSAGDPNAGVGMGLQMASQLALQKAQKENIEADTANKKAEATKTSGVDTDQTKTQIESLKQGIENAKAQESLTRVQEGLTKLNSEITGRTMEDSVEQMQWLTRRIITDFHNAENETFINTTTRNEKIQIIQQEALQGILKNILTKSEVNVNNAKIKQMAEQIRQGWEGLKQGQEQNTIKTFEAEIKANYPGVWNVAGKYVNDFVDGINSLMNLKDYKKHSVK